MPSLRVAIAIGCACLLAACGSDGSDSGDIGKVVDVKSKFGPEFDVKDVGTRGIDPKMLDRKLPEGLKFEPPACSKFVISQQLPSGLEGNMAAVTAEGKGNRFVVMALETSEPIPFTPPDQGCEKVGFAGAQVRGVVEAVEAPRITGVRTLGVLTVRQIMVGKESRVGVLYKYIASFDNIEVILIANPLVEQGKPVVPVDVARARDLFTAAVLAVKG